jgi:hypothetical protein
LFKHQNPLIIYLADDDYESLNFYEEEGLTLIHFAAMCNEIDIIIRLIKKYRVSHSIPEKVILLW